MKMVGAEFRGGGGGWRAMKSFACMCSLVDGSWPKNQNNRNKEPKQRYQCDYNKSHPVTVSTCAC